LGDFLSFSFSFLFISLLFESVSQDIQEFELDCRADLESD